MSFKYIDPGFGCCFKEGYSNQEIGVLKSYVYNPKFGVAFHSDFSGGRYLITYIGDEAASDLYVKFDAFFPESASSTIYISYQSKPMLEINQSGSEFGLKGLNDSSVSLNGDETKLKAGRVNTIWFHVETSSSVGRITVVINGQTVFDEESSASFTGKFSSGAALRFTVPSATPMSNLIISDEEVALNETILEIPASAIETTMTEQNGTYVSAEAGAYVLQVLDPTGWYGLFGSDTKISGMVAVAAPAFTTSENIFRLDLRKVNGETVTDYEVIDMADDWIYLEEMSEEEFTELEDKVPFVCHQLEVGADTTFASLDGLKIGWVTRG